jgi:hypothetical protein
MKIFAMPPSVSLNYVIMKILTILNVFVAGSLFCGLFFDTKYGILLTSVLCIMQISLVIIGMFITVSNIGRNLIMRIVSFFSSCERVELLDFTGNRRQSLAKIIPNTQTMQSWWQWENKIGGVILQPNGICYPGDASYVYFWYPMDKEKRAYHVLANDLPDLEYLDSLRSEMDKSIYIRNLYRNS